MLLEYEFVMVDYPWQIILHHKEHGIYFGAGSAPLT
jgi:hypothetical protein